MKKFSAFALWLAKFIPRGYWPLLRYAATRDPALWEYPLQLRYLPGAVVHADFRETVYTAFFREGCIPHQVGQDFLYSALIRPGDAIFDVGANIGYLSLLFAFATGPKGRVWAFEPGLRIHSILMKNLEQFPNINLVNLAVSDKREVVTFFESMSSDISSLLPIRGAVKLEVNTVSLDDFSAQSGAQPDFVKIDVEGHEDAVLRGMRTMLSSRNPPVVVFEALSERALRNCSAVFRDISGDRYDISRINTDGSLLSFQASGGTSDYLAVPPESRDRADQASSAARSRFASFRRERRFM